LPGKACMAKRKRIPLIFSSVSVSASRAGSFRSQAVRLPRAANEKDRRAPTTMSGISVNSGRQLRATVPSCLRFPNYPKSGRLAGPEPRPHYGTSLHRASLGALLIARGKSPARGSGLFHGRENNVRFYTVHSVHKPGHSHFRRSW
jgi:hypothetical protein